MEPAKSRIRRCAIYTRKSSEEGLEQDFNSLHAQREACEAYVKSQAGEGWQVVTTAYDDGGYSGGSMERPPLGYDVRDRHLVINRAEAATVMQICERYLELGSVRLLKHDLDRRGVSSKTRVSMKGLKSGGRSFSRGALYELLANPIYIGEIRHKRERHLGLHEAILERELWERVQQRLREQAAQRSQRPTKAGSSPLAGLLFDQGSEPLYAQSTAKGARRYRFYVSKSLITGSAKDAERGWRLSATEIERAVAIAARAILDDRPGVIEALEKSGIESPDVRATLETAADYGRRLKASIDVAACLTDLIERVELLEQGIRVSIKLPIPSVGHAEVPIANLLHLSRLLPLGIKRRGVETRIILEGSEDTPRNVDPALLKAIARATQWFDELAAGQVRSLTEVARRDGLPKRYVERITKLAFLAPPIVDAVVEGRATADLNLQMLMDGRLESSPEWKEQQRQLGL